MDDDSLSWVGQLVFCKPGWSKAKRLTRTVDGTRLLRSRTFPISVGERYFWPNQDELGSDQVPWLCRCETICHRESHRVEWIDPHL